MVSEPNGTVKADSVSSEKSQKSQPSRSPLEICVDEIEAEQAPSVFENSDQQSPKEQPQLGSKSNRILGKRKRI